MPNYPNAELITVAWIKTLDGVPALSVGTNLPKDNAVWAESGFVQVTSLPGTPNPHVPLQNAQAQIDCWANNFNSQKAPWGKAASLAQTVFLATYSFDGFSLTGSLVPAGIASVYPLTEPHRVSGDEAGFARFTFDLSVTWAVVPS